MNLAGPTPFGDLLVLVARWVIRGALLWGGLIALAATVEAASRGRVRATSWVATPPAVRRALLASLGILLAGAAPGPVSATVGLGSPHRPDPWGSPGEASGSLPVPARPTGRATPDVVRVRAGDTLWHLASARLPRGAGDAQVLAAVHRWHARNREVIGPDPDLIRPGQRLRPPTHHHADPQETP
jgi:nucleoid-associated protein YgaU